MNFSTHIFNKVDNKTSIGVGQPDFLKWAVDKKHVDTNSTKCDNITCYKPLVNKGYVTELINNWGSWFKVKNGVVMVRYDVLVLITGMILGLLMSRIFITK